METIKNRLPALPFFLGNVLPSSFTTHYYYFLIMNNFSLSLQRQINTHNFPKEAPRNGPIPACSHRCTPCLHTGGRSSSSMLIPTAVSPPSLGLMPLCQSVCCLPVRLPDAPVQVTIWNMQEQARRNPPGWYTWKEANPGVSSPPPGKTLASRDPHRLGRVGSRDMMHSLVSSRSAPMLSVRQLLVACGWEEPFSPSLAVDEHSHGGPQLHKDKNDRHRRGHHGLAFCPRGSQSLIFQGPLHRPVS